MSESIDDGLVPIISYEADVAPHLKRGLTYRHMRMQRWKMLQEQVGTAKFWRIAIPLLLLFWALVSYGIDSI